MSAAPANSVAFQNYAYNYIPATANLMHGIGEVAEDDAWNAIKDILPDELGPLTGSLNYHLTQLAMIKMGLNWFKTSIELMIHTQSTLQTNRNMDVSAQRMADRIEKEKTMRSWLSYDVSYHLQEIDRIVLHAKLIAPENTAIPSV